MPATALNSLVFMKYFYMQIGCIWVGSASMIPDPAWADITAGRLV